MSCPPDRPGSQCRCPTGPRYKTGTPIPHWWPVPPGILPRPVPGLSHRRRALTKPNGLGRCAWPPRRRCNRWPGMWSRGCRWPRSSLLPCCPAAARIFPFLPRGSAPSRIYRCRRGCLLVRRPAPGSTRPRFPPSWRRPSKSRPVVCISSCCSSFEFSVVRPFAVSEPILKGVCKGAK